MEVTIEVVNKTNRLLVENIEKRLEKRGWRVPQLAKAAGLSASGLYGVLDGSRWPGPDNLERIAKALGTTPSELLSDSSPKELSAAEIASVLSDLAKQPGFFEDLAAWLDAKMSGRQ